MQVWQTLAGVDGAGIFGDGVTFFVTCNDLWARRKDAAAAALAQAAS